VGRLDCRPDFFQRLRVRLRDDQGHGIFRRAAIDGLRLPRVDIAPSGVDSGNYFCRVVKLSHNSFPPSFSLKSSYAVLSAGLLSESGTSAGLPWGFTINGPRTSSNFFFPIRAVMAVMPRSFFS